MYAQLHDNKSVIPNHFKNERSMIVVDDRQEIIRYQTEKQRIEKINTDLSSLKCELAEIKSLLVTFMANKAS